MTNPLEIRAGEQRVVRLFALKMPPEQAKFLREPGAAAQVLGVDTLLQDQVEVFPVSDLEEVGLHGYLTQGCGIDPSQLDKPALDATTGWVLLLRSRALDGKSAILVPSSNVSLVGIYTEDGTDWSARPMSSESARPYSAPRVAPRKIRSDARRIGFALFAVVMTLILFVAVKIIL